jgi:hypothetical protein
MPCPHVAQARWRAVVFFLGLIALLAGNGSTGWAQLPDGDHESRFTAEVETVGEIRLGALVTVTVKVRARTDAPAASVQLNLPPGLTLLSGSSQWDASISAGQVLTRTATVRLDSTGIFRLTATVEDMGGSGEAVANDRSASAGRYLAVGKTGGFADRDYSERFLSPAIRALPGILGLRNIRPDPTPLAPGQSIQGSTRGSAGGPALRRALAALKAAGPEAIFADSASQVNAVVAALKADRAAQGRPAAEAMQTAPPKGPALDGAVAAAALTCSAGTVFRTGYVEYDNLAGTARVRLPLIRIRSASSYYGTPGIYTETRALADGSFQMCMPYSVEGYTFITAWQDNGAVFLMRDGASPPSAFPNFFSAVWDLNQSSFIPVHVTHKEAAFSMHTFYKVVQASNSIFTARRGIVNVWYFTNSANNYYCGGLTVFGCTKPGEAIYIHRYRPSGSDYIFSGDGQGSHAHEYGHAYDHDVIGGIGDCPPIYTHSYQLPSSVNCAVMEGWGDFFETITMPLARTDGERTVWSQFGTANLARSPEIEGAFTTYLFDLIDNSGFPAQRSVAADDDPVSVAPDYIIQVLKNGNTNYYDPTQNHPPMLVVQEIIAVFDDVTPIPGKAEFANYSQPTSITARVARSAALTVAQHRAIWLSNIFNKVEVPPAPVVVKATVPGLLTVKATYAITGSATGGTGGYSGWRWDRCDSPGCAYTLWANAQNSQFVAYAGDYTIYWRLFARDGQGVSDTDLRQTIICIQTAPCTSEPPLMVAGTGSPDLAASFRSANSKAPATHDPHYGSGPWLSRDEDADSSTTMFFSLTGRHEGWAPGTPVPNGVGASEGVTARHRGPAGGGSIGLEETRRNEPAVPGASIVQIQSRGLTAGSYHLSYAVDPDLGAAAGDDRLEWVDSLQTVVVSDPSGSEVMAYTFADVAPGESVSVVEYANSEPEREPFTSAAAFADQRRPTRVLGRSGDVRFILTRGPVRVTASGRIDAQLVTAHAATKAAALATIGSMRQRTAVASELGRGNAAGPATFGLRQSLSAGPSLSRTGTGAATGAVTTRAQLQMSGISALNYDVAGTRGVQVHIRIYGNTGQLVRVLLDEERVPGAYHVEWDCLNERGVRVPPGVYTAVMEAGEFRGIRKLVVTQ